MLKLFLDTTERVWYDRLGDLLQDEQPQIPFGNTETVVIQCCTNATSGSAEFPDPNSWPKDSQFDLPGVTAFLSIDNNFTRHLRGTLSAAMTAGEITSVTLNIPGASQGKIPPQGTIRFFAANGDIEALEYTSRSIENSSVTFELASGSALEQDYSVNTTVDCPEMLYAQAVMDAQASQPSTGLFAFNITVDSLKLQEKVSYSNTSMVDDIKGMELLIFTVQEESIQTRNAYLCDTFAVPVPMAEPNPNPQMPYSYSDNIAAITSALLSAGFDVETQVVDSVAQIRLKLANLGEDSWSEWVAIGYQLKVQYSADNTTWSDTADNTTVYLRTSTDGGATWSAGLLIKGDDGAAGGFGTPTATVNTLEPGNNATVSVSATGEDTAKVFTFTFGIPQGAKGDRGDSFTPDAIGATADKATYDAEPKGFAFLDSTTSMLYFKLSDTSGDWSDGTSFGKGDKGDPGEDGTDGVSAGFGTPTAAVVTLESDANATASVTASGDNTAKVFAFAFGIPKGQKGDTPVKGTDYFTEEDKAELVASLEDVLLNGEWGTEAE